MKHLASRIAVLVLVAYALLGVYSAAATLWQTQGTFGLVTDYGSSVRSVSETGPAASAGIVAGEHIRLAEVPFAQRRYLAGVGIARPPVGTIIDVPLDLGGMQRTVRLTAIEALPNAADATVIVFLCLASLVFIGVGAALIVLRPSPATWGFGLYCLLTLPTAMYAFPFRGARAALAATMCYDVVQNLGITGIVLFALEFPRRFMTPWRDRVRSLLPALFAVLVALTLWPDIANQLIGISAKTENLVLQSTFGVVFLGSIVILWDTFLRVARDERERLRWVLIGFSCGLFATYVGDTLIFSSLIADPPLWFSLFLTTLNVFLPLTVAHAVIRHRVLDVRIVVRQALVFAVATTVLAAVFALLDYLFGTVLEDFRLSRFIAAGLSITLAFTFKRLEERGKEMIEAIFYRERRAAEERLTRAAHLLPHARTAAVIDETLVAEAAAALKVQSAALYRRDANGIFVRAASLGWSEGDCAALDDSDLLVLALRSETHHIDLSTFAWRRTDLPHGDHAPVIAIPIRLREELDAFTLYAAHSDGDAIDAEEIAQLERLAYYAGLAFDALEAQAMRDENARQRVAIGDLTARLDELRHHSP